jgi:predicted porin
MNKKLMAAAVAGALAVPAGAAMAQTSSVQIYGLFNVEYAPWVDQPNTGAAPGTSRTTVDALNSGASRIGFRGQEKLGGSLTAWFQCETDVRFLNGAAADEETYDNHANTRWCDRNSALGLKGAWGNFYIGTWDSPVKRVTSATRMLNETGWLGVQRHLLTFAGWGYSHRVTRTLNYDSPNFSGFSVAFQTTTTDADKNQTSTTTAPGSASGSGAGTDGRIWGINGMYSSGPLVIGLGYQRYENNIQFAAGGFPSVGGVDGLDDTVWVFGVNYTFGNFKAGFVYTDLDVERLAAAGPVGAKRKNFNLALDWTVAGPHMVRFGWTHAGNTEGNAIGAGALNSGTTFTTLNTGGANIWQVSYNYSFSKRTLGAIGYIMVDNEDGGTHSLQGLGSVTPGDRSQALSLQLQHTF